MTEYEEITQDYKLMDFHRELEFQCNEMEFLPTDSFPMYLRDKINQIAIKKTL